MTDAVEAAGLDQAGRYPKRLVQRKVAEVDKVVIIGIGVIIVATVSIVMMKQQE